MFYTKFCLRKQKHETYETFRNNFIKSLENEEFCRILYQMKFSIMNFVQWYSVGSFQTKCYNMLL
jgi:hypothetical protein